MKHRIALDAGHGQDNRKAGVYDPGACEGKAEEHTKALGIVTRLKGDLDVLLWPTLMISSGNVGKRHGRAETFKAELYLSVHLNAGGGTGTETLYETLDSKPFAEAIQHAAVGALGQRDRGIKHRPDLAVLGSRQFPSALLEVCFIDDSRDLKALDKHVDAIELAVLQAIVHHFGNTPPKSLPRKWSKATKALYALKHRREK